MFKKRLQNWIAHLQWLQLWVTTVLILRQIICDVIAMLQVAYPPIKGHLDPHTSLLIENLFASFQRDWCQRDGGLECHPKKGPTIHGIVDKFLDGSRLDMMYRETEHICTQVVELQVRLFMPPVVASANRHTVGPRSSIKNMYQESELQLKPLPTLQLPCTNHWAQGLSPSRKFRHSNAKDQAWYGSRNRFITCVPCESWKIYSTSTWWPVS